MMIRFDIIIAILICIKKSYQLTNQKSIEFFKKLRQ